MRFRGCIKFWNGCSWLGRGERPNGPISRGPGATIASGLHHSGRKLRLIINARVTQVTAVTGGTRKSNLEIAAVWVDDGAKASVFRLVALGKG